MPLNQGILKILHRRLHTLDDDSRAPPALLADAQRLWNRLAKFLQMNVAGATAELDDHALQLACFALQFPFLQSRPTPSGRPNRPSLRQRCEQSAELMVNLLEGEVNDELLERATRVLQEAPRRSPASVEARLLADAVNLDDFGLVGLFALAAQLGAAGGGVKGLLADLEKRRQYGYWDARLKEGFHFPPVGQLARKRLSHAQQVADKLNAELAEDNPTG